jgi:hypothetical protein
MDAEPRALVERAMSWFEFVLAAVLSVCLATGFVIVAFL